MITPIKTFFDLDAWQEGRKLTNFVYKITENFPTEEKFGLISQMKRSAVSGIANIAEGFGRISIKEKLQFYNQAHGSITELQSHSIIAHDQNTHRTQTIKSFLDLYKMHNHYSKDLSDRHAGD